MAPKSTRIFGPIVDFTAEKNTMFISPTVLTPIQMLSVSREARELGTKKESNIFPNTYL